MAIDFPSNPSNGQQISAGGNAWQYNSAKSVWEKILTSGKIGGVITTYTNTSDLPLSGVAAGTQAFVTSSNALYISNGSGWYSIALVNTNPNITSVQDASSNTTPFTLAIDGTSTVITVTASDPEGVPLTYSYAVTSGSLTNGGGTTATVTQADNVFTVTPTTTEAYAGTFSLTFTVSDGVNTSTSVSSFTLEFITTIENSKYTTLLATATGTGDNNDITDSSTNNHTITVNGDVHAGTFSPYRHGGYSTYFDGTGDWLELTGTALGNGNFTVEAWVWLDSLKDYNLIYDDRATGSSATGLALGVMSTGAPYLYTNNGFQITSSQTCTANTWHHISLVRSSGVITIYLDGTSGGTYSSSANFTDTNLGIGVARTYTVTSQFGGYIRDVRAVVGSAITPASGGPTEPLTAVTNTSLLTCHLPYIADGSSNAHAITINGNTSTRPFTTFNNLEYSSANHGGSVYFDGTGDHLSAGTTTTNFGTGDFTIEAWIYKTTDASHIITNVPSGNDVNYFGIYTSTTQSHIQIRDSSGQAFAYGPAVAPNTWNHVAATRSSGSVRVFVNGVSGTPVTITKTVTSRTTTIGAFLYTGYEDYYTGYISDLRVIKGTALYTSDFTPPTAPLTAVTNTSLLVSGTEASIIDKSQNANLKLFGNTTGSTTQVKFADTKSMYFDGSGDYIEVDAEAGNFGTGDFTIETWLRSSVWNRGLFRKTTSTGSSSPPSISVYIASGTIYIGVNSGTANGTWITANNPFTLNTWGHLAITRASGIVTVYADGSSIVSATRTANVDNDISFRIGEWRNSTEYFSGYIQDFRLTKGLARYTANFTPPTALFEG